MKTDEEPMSWAIFGPKTCSVFDVWSFEHMLSGCSVGYLLRSALSDTRQQLLALGVIAFAWETLEHYLEEGILGQGVELWFQGVEFWANRCVADPLMMLVGWAMVGRWPKLVWRARVVSIVWLVVHIAVFPHSMYLQEYFGR